MENGNVLEVKLAAIDAKFNATVCRIDKRLDKMEAVSERMQSDIRTIQIELAALLARLGVLKYLGGLCLGGIVTLIVRSFY